MLDVNRFVLFLKLKNFLFYLPNLLLCVPLNPLRIAISLLVPLLLTFEHQLVNLEEQLVAGECGQSKMDIDYVLDGMIGQILELIYHARFMFDHLAYVQDQLGSQCFNGAIRFNFGQFFDDKGEIWQINVKFVKTLSFAYDEPVHAVDVEGKNEANDDVKDDDKVGECVSIELNLTRKTYLFQIAGVAKIVLVFVVDLFQVTLFRIDSFNFFGTSEGELTRVLSFTLLVEIFLEWCLFQV